MGKYINATSDGSTLPAMGKVQKLIQDGATVVPTPYEWEENLVCVAENSFFECAAYLYSPNEIEAFKSPCGRHKTYLKYPNAKTLAQ